MINHDHHDAIMVSPHKIKDIINSTFIIIIVVVNNFDDYSIGHIFI